VVILNHHYNKAEFYSILFNNEQKLLRLPKQEKKQFKAEQFEEHFEQIFEYEVEAFVQMDIMILKMVENDLQKYKYYYEEIEYSEIWYLIAMSQYNNLIDAVVIKK